MPWFEKSGGSKNRGFEKSGFHCSSNLFNVSKGLYFFPQKLLLDIFKSQLIFSFEVLKLC